MSDQEWERQVAEIREIHKRLEQFQLEAEENHARWHVNFQRSLDALVAQQARASAEMAELRDWGKELAKSHVRLQNSVADLKEQIAQSHRELSEAQKRADDRFTSFLAALERRFGSNGHF
jgi:chromosome segregation ATPase